MIFWILVAILVIAVVAIVFNFATDSWIDWGEFWGAIFWSFFIVALIALTVCGIGVKVQTAKVGEPQQQASYGLKALQNDSETTSSASGSFFLGFGSYLAGESISKSVNYIQVSDDGGATIQSVDISKAVIYEHDSVSPYVEVWANAGESDGFWVPWHYEWVSPHREYRFHIPTGAIIEGYEVSL